MVWLKALLFTVVVPGTVLGLVPGLLLADGHGRAPSALGLPDVLALLLGFAGASLYAACLRSFVSTGRGTPAPLDPPCELVAAGPYRRVRNPMYVGVLAVVAAEAIFFRSVTLAVYGGLLLLAFHLFVVLYEEPHLRRRFGKSYEQYLAAVPRWLPRRR